MKIVSGKTGTPHVTSQQFRQIMEGIIGDGSYILAVEENLEPELASNNTLKIRSGMMCHHGNISCVETGTYDEVELENGSQGMKRIDLVVNRYTRNEETDIESCEWVVLKGTPASSSPATPEYTAGNLQNGDLVDECPMFKVELDGIQVTNVTKMISVLDRNLADVPWVVEQMTASVLSQSGLAIRDNRCTITSGGYRKIGNMCYVQFQLKLNTALAGPNYWALIDKLPRPISRTAIAVSTDGNGGASRMATVDLADDGKTGTLVIRNSAGMSSGDIMNFGGFYMVSSS